MWDLQEPLPGQKARGVKYDIKHMGRINIPSFTMPDTQTVLGSCLCFKVTLPVCPGGGMAPLVSQQQLNPC